MKHIVKNPEPPTFTDWKVNWPNMTPGWDEFDQGTKQTDGTSIKDKVKEALIKEQSGLCCFCESRVGMKTGHIAHLLDQHNHPELELDYDNLLFSCPENSHNVPQTCGHAQGNNILPITPLDADCEWRFIYTGTGAIAARDENDADAIKTIEMLKLDHKAAIFRKGRAEAFLSVEDARREKSPEDFARWIITELQPQSDDNMNFKPFWTTRKFAAGLYS
jgi:uncharacterized protein (TIGR02646 family)